MNHTSHWPASAAGRWLQTNWQTAMAICRLTSWRRKKEQTDLITNGCKVVFGRCFRGLATCLIFAASPPAFADCTSMNEQCDADLLTRVDDYDYQLAVCQGNKWHVCKYNSAESHHDLIARSNKIYFYWAVPASDHHEIVYASTSYTHEQPLSIARNATYKGSRLFRVLAPFREVDKPLLGDQESVRQRFRGYHERRGDDSTRDEIFNSLSEWHQTEFVGQLKSYNLVGSSLTQTESSQPLLAAERLIRLEKERGKTSWVEFNSFVEHGRVLRIILAYSGSTPPRTWPFNFKVVPDTSSLD